jgi:serine/threonine protein kinase
VSVSPTPLPLEQLIEGRYQLVEVIGEGGMSVVYRAWDTRLGVERAIKILNTEPATHPGTRERFFNEGRTMARLRHPHIVTIHDVIQENGRICIIMELVRGGTAWQLVEREGPRSEAQAIVLIIPVIEAVAAAHAAGIVHRDIKPQNILLDLAGQPQLSDFGIAHVEGQGDMTGHTRTGAVLGTWGFMSPEQRTDASRVDRRSDQYGIGATLWALVKGRNPTDLFASDLEPEILAGFSPPMAELIRRATRYRPSERFEDLAAMAELAKTALGEVSTQAIPRPATTRKPRVAEESGTLHDYLEEAPKTVPDPTPPRLPAQNLSRSTRSEPRVWHRGWGPAIFALVAIGFLTVAPSFQMMSRWSNPEGRSLGGPDRSTSQTELPPLDPNVPPPPSPEGPPSPTEPFPMPANPPEPSSGEIAGETHPLAVDSVPEPPPESPTPTRTPPKPAPVPVNPPEPEPEPIESVVLMPPEPGRVSAKGDHQDLFLRDAEGNQFEPGAVPPGRYIVYASFDPDSSPEPAGQVDITENSRMVLRCDKVFRKCSPR